MLFADISGFTTMSSQLDAEETHALLNRFFAVVDEAVGSYGGAIDKHIGDAVMAAFGEPSDAVNAMLSIQNHVAAFNATQDDAELVIKLGGHAGKTIAVNLNGRLDYFGTTVNHAARLQQESQGGDVVLSDALANDPGVQAILENQPLETGNAAIKGFDEPIAYTRLRPPA